jgi:uncharacterized iron-regulated protein
MANDAVIQAAVAAMYEAADVLAYNLPWQADHLRNAADALLSRPAEGTVEAVRDPQPARLTLGEP